MASSSSLRCLLRAPEPTVRRARVPTIPALVVPRARPVRSPLSPSSRGTRGALARTRVVPVDLGFPPSELAFIPTPSQVFDLENVAIFPFWGAMMFAPKNPATKAVMSSYLVPFLTGAVYVYLVRFSFHDPRIIESFSTGKPDLEALAKGFSYEWCMAVGWAHFIAMDLFVGRWVYLDAQKNEVFAVHSLLLTLFFGPTGAISHVLTRTAAGLVRGEKLNDVMLPEEER